MTAPPRADGDRLRGAGVLVAGGASGLGAATVRALHGRGAEVVIADVHADASQALADELGRPAQGVGCDVTDPADVLAAIGQAERAPRGLRVAVVCAGIGSVDYLVGDNGETHALEAFERVLRVNLVGTFNVLRLAASAIRHNEPDADGERGVVILTGSLSGLEGAPGETAYAASKGGVHALTLPAARELAAVGVRVTTIAPGSFATPMMAGMSDELVAAYEASMPFPKRMGRPAEFASLVEHVVDNRMLNGAILRLDAAARHQ